MVAYWIITTVFMYGYLADKDETNFWHYALMFFTSVTVGWIFAPLVLGEKIRKL